VAFNGSVTAEGGMIKLRAIARVSVWRRVCPQVSVLLERLVEAKPIGLRPLRAVGSTASSGAIRRPLYYAVVPDYGPIRHVVGRS
jgi:hypothetical protein